MTVLTTILPIFVVIAMGAVARRMGFLPPAFLAPANRLVYHIAIPAMIFRAVYRVRIQSALDLEVLAVTAAVVALGCLAALGMVRWLKTTAPRCGTFVQSSFHGNLGYIGLPVTLYYLGEAGLASGSLIAGVVMIVQNTLAVFVLQHYGSTAQAGWRPVIRRILFNPVIFSALAGMGVSALQLPVPTVAERSLAVLSGMALPLALLLIGAGISFALVRAQWRHAAAASLVKLVAMPAIGLALYRLTGATAAEFMPAMILLCAPTATLTYVMGREMGGDEHLAVATVSLSTLLSVVTFSVWLAAAGGA
jgi:predicted permease